MQRLMICYKYRPRGDHFVGDADLDKETKTRCSQGAVASLRDFVTRGIGLRAGPSYVCGVNVQQGKGGTWKNSRNSVGPGKEEKIH